MKEKGTAAAILALLPSKKKGKTDEDELEDSDADDADESDEGKRAAGEELAAAIKSGDGAEIAAAFEALLDCCGH